mgnify:CR=1 FL=1
MDVRNKDGIWINSQVFREDALHFQKHGYYCADPWGSPAWYEYWNDRRNRIINGYVSQGVKVTGDHYFYLNFCPIMKTEDTTSKKSKISNKFFLTSFLDIPRIAPFKNTFSRTVSS